MFLRIIRVPMACVYIFIVVALLSCPHPSSSASSQRSNDKVEVFDAQDSSIVQKCEDDFGVDITKTIETSTETSSNPQLFVITLGQDTMNDFKTRRRAQTAHLKPRSHFLESRSFLTYLTKVCFKFPPGFEALPPPAQDLYGGEEDSQRIGEALETRSKNWVHVAQSKAVLLKRPQFHPKMVVFTHSLFNCVGVSFFVKGLVFAFTNADLKTVLEGRFDRLMQKVTKEARAKGGARVVQVVIAASFRSTLLLTILEMLEQGGFVAENTTIRVFNEGFIIHPGLKSELRVFPEGFLPRKVNTNGRYPLPINVAFLAVSVSDGHSIDAASFPLEQRESIFSLLT